MAKTRLDRNLCFVVFLLLLSLVSCLNLQSVEADVSNGLVGYWPFDEGTGSTAYDFSGYGNTGGIVNPTWVTGKIGGALYFNGLNHYVGVTDSINLNISSTITLSCWVKLASFAGASIQGILSKDNPGIGEGYGLYSFNSDIGSSVRIGSTWVNLYSTVSLDTWYFFAVTYDGVTLKCYINGVVVASTSISGSISLNNDPLYIGTFYSPSVDNFFNGTIDDARVYSRALTQSDITQLYHLYNPATPTASPNPSAPVASPVYVNSINSNWLLQYFNNWDFAGFVLAVWSAALTLEGFYIIVALILSVAVYLQMKSLIVVTVVWIVLGSFVIVVVPSVSPVVYLFYVLAFGALLYKVLAEPKN